MMNLNLNEFEIGKVYTTRGGRRAFCSYIGVARAVFCIAGMATTTSIHKETGRVWATRESPDDIIKEA